MKECIMKKLNASIAAAVLLLSGSAFAGSLQPAAGEAPFAGQAVVLNSSLQRQDVRADAARQLPAAGEMSAQATRAHQHRDARRSARGHAPGAGQRLSPGRRRSRLMPHSGLRAGDAVAPTRWHARAGGVLAFGRSVRQRANALRTSLRRRARG
jgi:hypothetical protein